ncbi:MmyB family transcriptional regulator [Streptomyces sp. NBC_01361]|uniref:MmyB family transcriptional regulator n=1 Tax=Streptomyces sp. NBC_01361 TaxID=2903838 RepID=UPI002E30810D|nr:hypothetical protein [Streptomyces sp. NBC_01361]
MNDIGELRRLLNRFRGRTSREQVGLPPLRAGRPGVRAKGLTQGAIDTLLDWPTGAYQRLESGRQRRIREEQLDDLGDLFQLNDAEYVELYVLATGQRPRRTRHPESDVAGPSLAAWRRMVDMVPEPAYVTDLEWDLVAGNAAFNSVFASGKAPQNPMRWVLFEQEAREAVLVDWATAWAPECISQLRVVAAENPENPRLQQLYQDVLDDPVLRRIHDQAEVSCLIPDGGIRPFYHRLRGGGNVSTLSAHLSGSPGATLVILMLDVTAPLDNCGSRDRAASSARRPRSSPLPQAGVVTPRVPVLAGI